MSTTWTRRITVTYHELKRSETSETTTTAILVEGPPLIHTSAKSDLSRKWADDLPTIRENLGSVISLLVPKGQEVILKDFHQPFHGLQLLTFRTICDHGD